MNQNKIRSIVYPKNDFKNVQNANFFSSKNMYIPMKIRMVATSSYKQTHKLKIG